MFLRLIVKVFVFILARVLGWMWFWLHKWWLGGCGVIFIDYLD